MTHPWSWMPIHPLSWLIIYDLGELLNDAEMLALFSAWMGIWVRIVSNNSVGTMMVLSTSEMVGTL